MSSHGSSQGGSNLGRLALRLLFTLAFVGLAAHVAHTWFVGPGVDPLVDTWLYDGLTVFGALACLARGVLRRDDRVAWLLLSAGVSSWVAGDLYFTLVLAHLEAPPYPSAADALYLGFYPPTYVALLLFVRERVRRFQRSLWVDGVTGGLAATAVGAAVLFELVVADTGGSTATVATNLAYPLADVLLLALVIGVFALTRGRPGLVWSLIAGAFALFTAADTAYLYQTASGTYGVGTIVDSGWVGAILLLALAAWLRPARTQLRDLAGRHLLLVPSACAAIGIGVLTYDHFEQLNHLAVGAAAATLVAVTIRLVMTFAENARMLELIRVQAVTDSLTGLGNRRKLMVDLEQELRIATTQRPRLLIVTDLDGFKRYNDTYGHPAGDSLLSVLASKFEGVVVPHGTAYRLGGDEFCALVEVPPTGTEGLVDDIVVALGERGKAFSVACSVGAAVLPGEAGTTAEALKLADRRLYANKHANRSSVGAQTQDALLQVLDEREPDLRSHVSGVAELAVAVGRLLNLGDTELEQLARAAELHDIGKLAIPDTILQKPGALDEDELVFVRKHTMIGERILGAAPALGGVARLVRSTHERWDGEGYPDGLAGEKIARGARIISVCDAFEAMTSDRPYRRALITLGALSELRRCAGTQFDPAVVEAFCTVWDALQADEAASMPVPDAA